MATTGPIATFTGITGGAGYANGTYNNVALTGGNGSGAFANITVAGGAVTAVVLPSPSAHQTLDRVGKNYQTSDVLSANAGFDAAGAGAGFLVNVGTLARACENCFYGKIVPPSAGAALFGQRFCGNSDYSTDNKLFALQLLGQQGFVNHSSLVSPSFEGLITQDDFFCGDGADITTGVSFSSIINNLPSQVVPSSTSVAFATGDWKWQPISTALAGWVRANTNTIGNAASAGTERANADTVDLFAWFWNNFSNTLCPVSTGRGATAAADFAANKNIATLDMRGRAPFGLADMGAANSNRLVGGTFTTGNSTTAASSGGEAVHILSTAEMPAHTHGDTDSTSPNAPSEGAGGGFAAGADSTFSTGSTGGGGSHNTLPPFMLGTWYVKL